MNARHNQHPTPEQLAAFGVGRLEESAADEVYRHLESCAQCQRAVEAAPNDTLADLVRRAETGQGAVSAPDGPPHKAADHRPHKPSATEPGRPGETLAEQSAHSEAETAGFPAGRSDLADFLAPPQAPGDLGCLGPYRILKVLGSGGMGVVYLAVDPNLQRQVALKAMLPALAASQSARSRFLREARLAASLEHDNIVPIYQVGEDRGIPYLAMQLLKGEPLDVRLQRELKGGVASPLPLTEALRIARETAEGLAAAHKRGLIHRDIKPANLWLEGERGRVRILDFGLARSIDGDVQLTREGAILGTPAYMAPEQAGGKVGRATDLFSLGCVLYRLCTGQPPFKGADAMAILLAIAADQPAPPRELNPRISAELSGLILRLLAKKPEDRPPTARAVVEAIRAIEADPTAILPPPPLPPRKLHRKPTRAPRQAPMGPPSSRWIWLVGGLAVGLSGLAVAAALWLLYTGIDGRPFVGPKPAANRQRQPGQDAWVELFKGKNLAGWQVVGDAGAFVVAEDQLAVAAKASSPVARLESEQDYTDFDLRFEFRIVSPAARSGVDIRMPPGASGTLPALKVQIRDDSTPYPNAQTGEVYYAVNGWLARERDDLLKARGEWNEMEVIVQDRRVRVVVNGKQVVDGVLPTAANKKAIPEAQRASGRIALEADLGEVWYRNIAINELPLDDGATPSALGGGLPR